MQIIVICCCFFTICFTCNIDCFGQADNLSLFLCKVSLSECWITRCLSIIGDVDMRFMMMNEDSFSRSDEDDDGYDINHDDD